MENLPMSKLADLIITNARVFTSDEKDPHARIY